MRGAFDELACRDRNRPIHHRSCSELHEAGNIGPSWTPVHSSKQQRKVFHGRCGAGIHGQTWFGLEDGDGLRPHVQR